MTQEGESSSVTTGDNPGRGTPSLVECALQILECPDPWKKAELTYDTVKKWRDGTIKRVRPMEWRHLRAPDRPARSDDKAPRRGKGGTLASRQALLHSAVHIENWAVDLSWDVLARFGLQAIEYELPRAFFDDFVTVAEDECRHFSALAKRLEEIGSHYGAFAVHDGLWESAANTSHSLPARLAVEHCVHEARGLDVLPGTIAKFANNGDAQSAALLRDVVYPEEVSHCAAGVRWIRYLYDVAHGRRQPAPPADPPAEAEAVAEAGSSASASAAAAAGDASGAESGRAAAALGALSLAAERDRTAEAEASGVGEREGDRADGVAARVASWREDALRYDSVEAWFHSLVRSHFWGALKPPFNEEARAQAGFGPEWYLPLATAAAQPAAAPAPEPAAAAASAAEATKTVAAAGAEALTEVAAH
ncbi:hypothetical protein GPECTOR_210g415 [Gonium pectorale]|uniref:Uncharacterized protein n=1 Tax=Gonium pectorale TaxID=33097 RepID=A0A150FWT3_GONPE|nr:hypothetical protein GPECTOR_210g415 [Gonium pectorale]|eukprot:KXZ42072.1 hypothetical protein GPECTOR_210g415 [Gonium pectorale]